MEIRGFEDDASRGFYQNIDAVRMMQLIRRGEIILDIINAKDPIIFNINKIESAPPRPGYIRAIMARWLNEDRKEAQEPFYQKCLKEVESIRSTENKKDTGQYFFRRDGINIQYWIQAHELRRSEEELRSAYTELKARIVKELREGIDWHLFVSLKSEGLTPLYPHISREQEADLVERGEVEYRGAFSGEGAYTRLESQCFYWVDNEREEAKNPAYLRKITRFEEMAKENGWTISPVR